MPAAPVLDPTSGNWMFDANVLINLLIAGLAGVAMMHFKGRAYLAEEVLLEINRGSAGDAYARLNALVVERLTLEADFADYLELRRRWSMDDPLADRGEAASIILAKKAGYSFVTDDGVGYKAATREVVATTRTPQLVIAMVRAGWITTDEGWEGMQKMVAVERRLGTLPWNDRPDFDAFCAPGSREDAQ